MTVIQLLNKIANGEEVPKKIFYKTGGEYTGGYYWIYDESFRDYKDKVGDYVFTAGNYHIIDMLNMEVEVIEEDKKIERLQWCNIQGDSTKAQLLELRENVIMQFDKINEIIDKLNEMENE